MLLLCIIELRRASQFVFAYRGLMEMSIYDELSVEDAEALSQIDDGAGNDTTNSS